MKKRHTLIAVLLLIIAIFITLIKYRDYSIEKRIYKLVRDKEIELIDNSIEIIEQRKNNTRIEKEFYKAIVDGVYENDGNIIVQYTFNGTGLLNSSKYYGFYYSKDNLPAAFQNENIILKESGKDTWEWEEENTDNGGVTKKITDYLFYYEAWF